MASNSVMIHKLQQAINGKGHKVLYSTTQFYSAKQDRPITVYHLYKATFDEDRGKMVNTEVFKSTSQIQIVLYLRDMWFDINGWDIPQDNTQWNNIKEQEN